MALIDKLTALADAIRRKTGSTEKMTLDGMASAVDGIQAGGGSEIEEQFIRVIEHDTSKPVTSLPAGLGSIGDYAFSQYKNLAFTSLPAGVKSIGMSAFASSNVALTSLPAGLGSIGNNAFHTCGSLALMSLPAGLKSIGAYAFSMCSNLVIAFIPAGVTSVGSNAFSHCPKFTRITFEGIPKTLHQYAFASCTNLVTMNVPWAEGEVSGAPWGATNATINYNYTGE